MYKNLRYAALLVIMAFLVVGCFGLGPGPVVDPGDGGSGNGGSDDGTPDKQAAFNASLDAFVTYSEAKAWDDLAGLYTFPLTLTAFAKGSDQFESESELREQYSKESQEESVLNDFPEFADDIVVESFELTVIDASEEGDTWFFTFEQEMELTIHSAEAAAAFLALSLFSYYEQDGQVPEVQYSVEFAKKEISPVENTMTAELKVTIETENDPYCSALIMDSNVTFTFVEDGSDWKIQRHEQELIRGDCIPR